MDLAIHDEILWCACVKAAKRMADKQELTDANDPRAHFPWLVRGSWMNDMNQVSPLLDFSGNPNIIPQTQTLFQGLWNVTVEDLLANRLQNFTDNGPLVKAAPGILASKKHNVNGFGRYNRFDHLDVTDTDPAKEYDDPFAKDRLGRAHTAHTTVTSHVVTRLESSLADLDLRRDPRALTALGRGLHTLADVFAHSNYVELLLWSLAWRNQLSPTLINAFNKDNKSNDKSKDWLRCPLPPQGPRDPKLFRNAILWYGDSPEETPFVSSLFDTNDTVFSLLHIYAAHLRRTDGKPQTEPMLDIAMAIFDIQGAPLIKAGWAVLEGIGNVFDAIGQAARSLLASGMEASADNASDQKMRDLMHSTAGLIRTYDSQKAKDWAEAGQLSFLARELQSQMVLQLAGQTSAVKLLPHHSLLAKDHVENEASGLLRFKLACMLATEVSAQLMERHFSSGTPNVDDYKQMADRVLIHPWQLLDNNPNLDKTLGSLMRDIDGSDLWQDQTIDGVEILGGVL